jgi:hypothetical protein
VLAPLSSIAPAVRLPFARAPDGSLRWARDRVREGGASCVCVGCGAPVVLRAGDVRRAHYAHASRAPCGGETALHRGTIEILALEIERASRERRALLAPSACRDCDLRDDRNLARLTELRALREHVVTAPGEDGCTEASTARPDLLVVRGSRPAYAVEVVVTHAPEEGARQVLAQRGIPIVIVRPTWDALTVLELPLASVSALGAAAIEGAPCHGWRHPPSRGVECAGCERAGLVATMQRWSGAPCWRCGARVPFADLRVHDERAADDCDAWDGQPLFGVDAVGPPAIAVAASLGVFLAERWTYRAGRHEVVHACPECGVTQARAARGAAGTPEAVAHVSWCRRCRDLVPLGAPHEREARTVG